ncbi:MAG: hypothetical protein ACTSU5_13660 [Promethearchaeota archaeon]
MANVEAGPYKFTGRREFGKGVPLPSCDPEFAAWSMAECVAEIRGIREQISRLLGGERGISERDFWEFKKQANVLYDKAMVALGHVLEAIYERKVSKARGKPKFDAAVRRRLEKYQSLLGELSGLRARWEELGREKAPVAEALALLEREEAVQWRQVQLVWEGVLREFPDFFVIFKVENHFQCLVSHVARPFNRVYNSHYTTTFYPGIYVPHTFLRWRPSRIVELFDHERVHLRQYRRVGGTLPFLFLYNLVPFPVLIAYVRYKWEREAYERTILHEYNWRGPEYVRSDQFIDKVMVPRLNGSEYGFTWFDKGGIRRWVLETVDKVERGLIK